MYVNDQSIQIVKAAARVPSETDEALAWQATQEVEAFHELYRRYALPIYRYHVAWKGNAYTAQSLTSQTFFEAYSKLTAYQLGGLFIKRIFGIARDLRSNHSWASGDNLRPDTSAGIDGERLMPESGMTLQVDISSLARAINRLSDDMAEAFVLRVFAGFDASEIGLIMVKSDVTVKMLVYRSLCELNRLLYLRNLRCKMIDREVYQAEELDCYLETICAGQFSQHSFNLPETEQNLVEMILGISARAYPACIDLGLETVQNLTHKVVLMVVDEPLERRHLPESGLINFIGT